MKVRVKSTNEIKEAVYVMHRGNLRYYVDGKAYSDKQFDKKFKTA